MRISMPSRAYRLACASLPILAGGLLALASPSGALATETCSNERLRAESNVNPSTGQHYSVALPDCRAYELVSSGDNAGQATELILATGRYNHAVESAPAFSAGISELVIAGGYVFYYSKGTPAGTGAIPDGGSPDTFRSGRTSSGWATTDLTPFPSAAGTEVPKNLIAVSSDGLKALVYTGDELTPEAESDPFHRGEGRNFFLLRPGASPALVTHGLLPRTSPEKNSTEFASVHASSDLSTVAFSSEIHLAPEDNSTTDAGNNPGTPGGSNPGNFYAWSEVPPSLAQLIAPPIAEEPNERNVESVDAVLPDGRLIIDPNPHSPLGTRGFTVGPLVQNSYALRSEGEYTPLSGPNGGVFQALTPDGNTAYVLERDALVPSDTNSSPDLYAVSTETGVSDGVQPTGTLNCLSCTTDSDDVTYVGQSVDGSHIFFTTDEGLWSWNGTTSTLLTTATDLSVRNLVFSQNGQFVVGVSSQALSPEAISGSPAVYVFTDGASPRLITPPELFDNEASSDGYSVVSVDALNVPGPAGGVSNDGARVVYNRTPAQGQPEVIDEWKSGGIGAGETGQISPQGSAAAYRIAAVSGTSLEDVFFEAHEPLVAQDENAGLADIYDARTGGGFPAPAAPVHENVTPNPTGPTTPAYTPNLTPIGIQIPPLLPDTASPASISKAKPLTQVQKLARTLKACKKVKRRRAACEAQARRKYGTKSKTKKTAKGAK